jgi:hypothetical protein
VQPKQILHGAGGEKVDAEMEGEEEDVFEEVDEVQHVVQVHAAPAREKKKESNRCQLGAKKKKH